jgi:membrane-associated protein
MDLIYKFFDLFLHLNQHLDWLVSEYGALTYLILFLIVFCETGLVITPFLPGDSLLFAAGALASRGNLDILLLMGLLIIAAVVGDAVNYSIGRYLGPKVFERESRIFKRKYLIQTQEFYEKYGSKAIVIARFVPIVRTFAPFLAGVGEMKYSKFVFYNVAGALIWVISLCGAGYLFAEVPFVKRNFSLVIMLIILISILPIIIEFVKAKRAKVTTVIFAM